MVSRRKGEMNRARLDRDYPHQVALPEGMGNFNATLKLAQSLSAADRHKSVSSDGQWFTVWCFSKPEDAAAFKAELGGEECDPKDIGKGGRWHLWDRRQS